MSSNLIPPAKIPASSNGRTWASEAHCIGSNPFAGAKQPLEFNYEHYTKNYRQDKEETHEMG